MTNPSDGPVGYRDRVGLVMKTLSEAVTMLDGLVGHESCDSKELKESNGAALDVLTNRLERLQEKADYVVRQLERVAKKL